MLGLLFVAFLITLIVGAVLTTVGDELHHLWLAILDSFHKTSVESHYKQIHRAVNAPGLSRASIATSAKEQ